MDSITTTCGEKFTYSDHCKLAVMIYRRWGRDTAGAANAWRRLFQNSCSDEQFQKMIDDAIVFDMI